MMVRRADRHRVDALAHLLEHLAIVGVFLGARESLCGAVEGVLIHVADRHDVAKGGGMVGIAFAFSSDADTGEIDFLIRRLCAGPGAPNNPDPGTGQGGVPEKLTSAALLTHGFVLFAMKCVRSCSRHTGRGGRSLDSPSYSRCTDESPTFRAESEDFVSVSALFFSGGLP